MRLLVEVGEREDHTTVQDACATNGARRKRVPISCARPHPIPHPPLQHLPGRVGVVACEGERGMVPLRLLMKSPIEANYGKSA